jgi:predicted N-acetyltransferase YhbS
MKISSNPKGREQDLVDLFKATFTASEGADEGTLIAELVRKQLAETPADDIHVFTAEEDGSLLGACVFTRLTYAQDDRTVFVLAPVAVMTERQGQGIGQKLLRQGLNVLRDAGVDVAMTYGDPNYYQKVGFQPVSEDDAPAPFKLQFPHGWLGQSLTDRPWSALSGPSYCVPALNDPVFW